jgi:hypothetical protein
MPLREQTLKKIQYLPEPLIQEVSDFIDFIFLKQDQTQSDLFDYLPYLETYEERLAQGEITW